MAAGTLPIKFTELTQVSFGPVDYSVLTNVLLETVDL